MEMNIVLALDPYTHIVLQVGFSSTVYNIRRSDGVDTISTNIAVHSGIAPVGLVINLTLPRITFNLGKSLYTNALTIWNIIILCEGSLEFIEVPASSNSISLGDSYFQFVYMYSGFPFGEGRVMTIYVSLYTNVISAGV